MMYAFSGNSSFNRYLILGGLAALLSVGTAACNNDPDEPVVAAADTKPLAAANEHNMAVTDYVSFIGSDVGKMTLDHEYTSLALTKLNNAIASLAAQIDYDVKGDLEQSRSYADMITKNPYETTHADNIRKSADILSKVLNNMQQAKFTQLAPEAEAVKNAAAAIDPETLTLQQKDQVKDFFIKAADLLQKMN